jgi:biopolymer transport protein ExbB/TolQ
MNLLVSETALKTIEYGLLGLVLGLGVVSVALFAVRQRVLGMAVQHADAWRRRLSQDLSQEMSEVAADLNAGDDKPPATQGEAGAAERLVRLGLAQAELCPEALERLLLAQERRERRNLERGASFLGTVGANAPFLGLTGTVLGILSAFRRMAEQGGSGGTEVMAAIAGALIATAAGLIVAIPAVVLYNVLKGSIKKAMEDLAEIRELLVARSLQATSREFI